ncbi:transposase (plasmid) [Mesorhizobium sp. AR07]|uniref:transposase n=1 Tax=Mesorhizobium sp. AR07 TaxID=2865838 RepID=UPI00215F7517|nr:transposase [Mesorhizobium sp. AR07]UVK49127.1 transposase [Mesorhizobium sp. AR07]
MSPKRSRQGGNVSAVARSEGLDPSQLYAWRRKALSSGCKFTRFEAVGSDTVEIVIGDAVVRAGGDVDPDRLARIIRAVRKA